MSMNTYTRFPSNGVWVILALLAAISQATASRAEFDHGPAGGDHSFLGDDHGYLGDDHGQGGGDHGQEGHHPRMTLLEWSYGSGGHHEPSNTIVSDRPGFGNTPVTVGYGVHQLEIGYEYIYDHHGHHSEEIHSYPDALLRVGMLAEWF